MARIPRKTQLSPKDRRPFPLLLGWLWSNVLVGFGLECCGCVDWVFRLSAKSDAISNRRRLPKKVQPILVQRFSILSSHRFSYGKYLDPQEASSSCLALGSRPEACRLDTDSSLGGGSNRLCQVMKIRMTVG